MLIWSALSMIQPMLTYLFALFLNDVFVVCGGSERKSQNFDSVKGECIQDLKANITHNVTTKKLAINLRWSVSQDVLQKINGFQAFCIPDKGAERPKWISKRKRSCQFELPSEMTSVQEYTVHVECSPLKRNHSKSILLTAEGICDAYKKSNIPLHYHCLTQLENVTVQNCHTKEVQISWTQPDVIGHRGFLIRKAIVDCEGGSCCQHANYDESFEVDSARNNVTLARFSKELRYCLEILICGEGLLSCHPVHPPIFVNCAVVEDCCFYALVSGIVALSLVILGIALLAARKYFRRKKLQREDLTNTLLAEVSELKAESENDFQKKPADPLLLIIYHTGCAVIEQIVLHLTQFFRLNGINAVSELTAEDQIHKHGRGVYLNEMLRQADFVLVLCTEALTTREKATTHSSYMFALKAIQNKVVEQGDDLGRYFMVHFNEVSNIPDILRSTSIDVAGNLQSSLSVIVRRIYGVESFRFDLGSPCKNEVEFSSQAMNEMDAVSQCRDGFMSLKHTKCLYDTCRKGGRFHRSKNV